MEQIKKLKLKLAAGLVVASLVAGLVAFDVVTADNWQQVMLAVVQAMFAD